MGSVDRNIKVDVSRLKKGVKLVFKFKYETLTGYLIDTEKTKNDKLLRIGRDGDVYNITIKDVLEIIEI